MEAKKTPTCIQNKIVTLLQGNNVNKQYSLVISKKEKKSVAVLCLPDVGKVALLLLHFDAGNVFAVVEKGMTTKRAE